VSDKPQPQRPAAPAPSAARPQPPRPHPPVQGQAAAAAPKPAAKPGQPHPGVPLASWRPGQPLRLETERYVVRSMAHEDVCEDYLAWTKDEEIMTGVNSAPSSMTVEDLHKYIDRFNNKTSFHFGVFLRETGRLIGFYSCYWERRHNLASTNVVIGDKAYWGKGAVLETRDAIIDFLFDRLKVGKIWGNPMARNVPSVFNYKAQGFRCEAVLKRHRVSPTGERVDQFMFGLFPEEWAAHKAKRAAAKAAKRQGA
jgi:ribosomal-protein-alanine N-acetyltransferase